MLKAFYRTWVVLFYHPRKKEITHMSNVSEGKICREVIDRHDVMKNQIISVIREVVTNIEHDDLLQVKKNLDGIFQAQTNGLVDSISAQFSQ